MMAIYRFAGCVGVFLAGIVAAIQLEDLIPHNPAYEASWLKFGFAVAVAVACAVIIIWTPRD